MVRPTMAERLQEADVRNCLSVLPERGRTQSVAARRCAPTSPGETGVAIEERRRLGTPTPARPGSGAQPESGKRGFPSVKCPLRHCHGRFTAHSETGQWQKNIVGNWPWKERRRVPPKSPQIPVKSAFRAYKFFVCNVRRL